MKVGEDKLENFKAITFKVDVQSSLNKRQSFQNAINSHDSWYSIIGWKDIERKIYETIA